MKTLGPLTLCVLLMAGKAQAKDVTLEPGELALLDLNKARVFEEDHVI